MLGTNAGYHCNRTFLESLKQSKRNVADFHCQDGQSSKNETLQSAFLSLPRTAAASNCIHADNTVCTVTTPGCIDN
jgi:hypothetical protein